MRRFVPTIAKRQLFNINRCLEIGGSFRLLDMARLYRWDLVSIDGHPCQQGRTRCLHRGDIVIYAGREDNIPTFTTADNFTGKFKPVIYGEIPKNFLEVINPLDQNPNQVILDNHNGLGNS